MGGEGRRGRRTEERGTCDRYIKSIKISLIKKKRKERDPGREIKSTRQGNDFLHKILCLSSLSVELCVVLKANTYSAEQMCLMSFVHISEKYPNGPRQMQ